MCTLNSISNSTELDAGKETKDVVEPAEFQKQEPRLLEEVGDLWVAVEVCTYCSIDLCRNDKYLQHKSFRDYRGIKLA